MGDEDQFHPGVTREECEAADIAGITRSIHCGICGKEYKIEDHTKPDAEIPNIFMVRYQIVRQTGLADNFDDEERETFHFCEECYIRIRAQKENQTRLENLFNYLLESGYPHSMSAEGMMIDTILTEIGWLLKKRNFPHPSLKIMDKTTLKHWHKERLKREREGRGINDYEEVKKKIDLGAGNHDRKRHNNNQRADSV